MDPVVPRIDVVKHNGFWKVEAHGFFIGRFYSSKEAQDFRANLITESLRIQHDKKCKTIGRFRVELAIGNSRDEMVCHSCAGCGELLHSDTYDSESEYVPCPACHGRGMQPF